MLHSNIRTVLRTTWGLLMAASAAAQIVVGPNPDTSASTTDTAVTLPQSVTVAPTVEAAPVALQNPGSVVSSIVSQPSPAPISNGPTQKGTSKLFSIPPETTIPAPANEDGFQLNFVDTEIATIAAAILGDGLNVPYVVDPQVKGTLTLQATRPLSPEETLASFEAALRIQNAALVDVNGIYTITPIKEAAKRITTLRLASQGLPGFGIYIVPLQYVGVADMEKLLQPFAPEGGIMRVDAARNLLLLAGTAQEISTLMSVVNTFDVDWLSGMSFAMYPLLNVDAKTLSSELAEVFSDTKSPIAGVVRLVPLSRLNSIMVVTPQERYLREVETWIKRFDVANTTPGRRIYVYDVQNGKADELAKSLSSILSLNGGASTTSSSFSTTAPTADTPRTSVTQAPSATIAPVTSASESDASNVKIVPNEENNSLLIMASPSEYGLIEVTLKRLDTVPIQVVIEASIAEVTLTDDLRFGIQWNYKGANGPITLSSASTGTINQQFPGLSFLYTGRADISAVLNTIASRTNVRVLSSPKLIVLNNRAAQLQIGDQVPVVTQSAVSTSASTAPIVNAVQLRDTGVIMRVTPRANKSGRIFLEVAQEVSNVVPTNTSGIDSPTIQQRKISTVVSVEDGETIALGGLIKESDSRTRSGVPILSRIPLFGTLFGDTGKNKLRTELIVLLTPRIIRSSNEAEDATRELQEQFKNLQRYMPDALTSSLSIPSPDGRASELSPNAAK